MRIENPVTRVTTRHHEVCWLMPNSYPEWRDFQFAPHNHYGFFFLYTFPLTSAFKLKYVLFYQFNFKFLHLRPRNLRFVSYLWCCRQKVWRKMTSKKTSWHPARKSSCTHLCKTTFSCTGQWCGNAFEVCKNVAFDQVYTGCFKLGIP